MITSKSHQAPLPDQLKPEYMQFIASWLLDEALATEDSNRRNSDNAYTRGSTRFGRQRQRILNEHCSGQYPWLGIISSGNDFIFSINGIPCRFSDDNPKKPSKRAVLEVHLRQRPLLEDAEPDEAARFVFVVDRGPAESNEPRVVLLGFSKLGDVVHRWYSSSEVRIIGDALVSLPAAVDLPKPQITLKQRQKDADAAATGP